MLYCFINNVHVDYVELLWQGLYYFLTHPTSLIPYPRFMKIIINHYMNVHPNISRRVHDNYHRIKNDDLVKNIFKSRKNKEGSGLKISDWMLTDEMKLTVHYQMRIMCSTQVNSEDEFMDDVERLKEHMVDEELDPLLAGTENVDADAFMDDVINSQEDPDTRIELRSDKESPKAKKDVDMVTIHDEKVEEGSVEDEFELRNRDKGKGIKETRDTPTHTPIRSPRNHISPLSTDKETLKELTVTTKDAHPSANKEKL
ncbi:hypothetical protein Tco_1094796 [Tanacetum coccineum]|uniref:Uncharacterized protein n=1 Tax=Tanacetum coccineum TaxID=301880 RepID=A0ABQ5IIY1_9ASTR